ncbi:Thaumatin-like protein [Acorus gramineus]|uniref:Thaumatin-like protein n=1 Tax=Acorus gramineus TaxID=55184 RepID=A0AAV9A4H2_ACOGR|nr:Thaumatin-like protein [Acorus gramineus]
MASLHLLIALALTASSVLVKATLFTLRNNCDGPVWPGIQPGSGHPALLNGGFRLAPNDSARIPAPPGWSGRFWARRGCSFDPVTGRGACATGDCGGSLECAGAGGAPPVTLAEFTLDAPVDFYDVSLVDGYNLPVSVVPLGGSGDMCRPVTCVSDLNRSCPGPLRVTRADGAVVACMSACMAFDRPEFCCTGQHGSPATCGPTEYSRVFKRACPSAYSYAYDDATSTFTCKGADYLISFC